ncbi:hypothetical protein RFH45_18995 [Acinetobacter baumannii]|nr:hypothetical protein [Acinetobacter baumannii]MDQ8916609.1 hypothetical protein [Acinetobacter baumannii]MDQ8958253.1 hypothetical protein [Acinetobacter baumannii]MDQ8986851.1 hypothetical protein [Acinetobacter baumannii]MDQ8994274.1 hypothetical protein [Acinetobacter baumannii]
MLMFITSFGEQNITYKCCSNFLIHLCFFKKTEADSIPLYRFAVDANYNVFNSDELPALAQIGTDWKVLNE